MGFSHKAPLWEFHIAQYWSAWYAKHSNVNVHSVICGGWCVAGILESMFRLLDAYRNKQYVTPRVLQLVLSYLSQS